MHTAPNGRPAGTFQKPARSPAITVTPDEGYELERLRVLDSRDGEIALTDEGDGKYTFTMPAGRVTVRRPLSSVPRSRCHCHLRSYEVQHYYIFSTA